MAARGWATSITTAIGVAAGAGAAQLGLGYGMGIIAWVPDTQGSTINVWLSSLAWVLWVGGTSTIIGAIYADRMSAKTEAGADPGRGAHAVDVAWRIVIALAAAIGALSTRAIATNAIASVTFMWVLAVIAVIDGVRATSKLGTAQLAVWDFTNGGGVIRNTIDWPSAVLMLGSAFVIGGLAAWLANRRGDSRVGVAISGVTGPLLVAAAYFLAAPRMLGVDAHQLSAFLIAPYAVLAGLAGSVLVVAVGSRTDTTPSMSRAEEEAALADWAQRLNRMDASEPAAEPEHEDADEDLADDVYAPARAYTAEPAARAYASDFADGEGGAATTSTTTAPKTTGRSAVEEPLWPEQAKPASKRRTRGKSSRREPSS